MNLSDRIEAETRGKIFSLLGESKFRAAIPLFPTEIFHLKAIVESLGMVVESPGTKVGTTRVELLAGPSALVLPWLNSLLKNPFYIRKILGEDSYAELLAFLVQAATPDLELEKIKMQNIGILTANTLMNDPLYDINKVFTICDGQKSIIYIDNAPKGIIYTDNAKVSDCKRDTDNADDCRRDYRMHVDKISYYEIMKEISKVYGNIRNVVDIEITSGDFIIVKRLKAKIRSHSATADTAKVDVEKLMQLINENHKKLGWTISKSIFRITKFLDKGEFIASIFNSLKNKIMGDEMLWINMLSILSFLYLEGAEGSDSECSLEDVTLRALEYDRERDPNSALLRETAIFFIWCYTKHQELPGALMLKLVSMALFDVDFQVRKAAVTVILEYVGRGRGFGGICDSSMLAEINLENVKRGENYIDAFRKIKRKGDCLPHVIAMISHYDQAVREKAATLISEFYRDLAPEILSVLNQRLNPSNLHHMDGLFMAYNALERELDIPFNASMNLRFPFVISSYLRCARNFGCSDLPGLKTNIIRLIRNDYDDPWVLADLVLRHQNDTKFTDEVASLINENGAGMIANSLNLRRVSETINFYISSLTTPNAHYSRGKAACISKHNNEHSYVISILKAILNLQGMTLEDTANNTCANWMGDGCIIADSLKSIICLKNTMKNIVSLTDFKQLGTLPLDSQQLDLLIRFLLKGTETYTFDRMGDSSCDLRRFSALTLIKMCPRVQGLPNILLRLLADKSSKLREDLLAVIFSTGFPGSAAEGLGFYSKRLGFLTKCKAISPARPNSVIKVPDGPHSCLNNLSEGLIPDKPDFSFLEAFVDDYLMRFRETDTDTACLLALIKNNLNSDVIKGLINSFSVLSTCGLMLIVKQLTDEQLATIVAGATEQITCPNSASSPYRKPAMYVLLRFFGNQVPIASKSLILQRVETSIKTTEDSRWLEEIKRCIP